MPPNIPVMDVFPPNLEHFLHLDVRGKNTDTKNTIAGLCSQHNWCQNGKFCHKWVRLGKLVVQGQPVWYGVSLRTRQLYIDGTKGNSVPLWAFFLEIIETFYGINMSTRRRKIEKFALLVLVIVHTIFLITPNSSSPFFFFAAGPYQSGFRFFPHFWHFGHSAIFASYSLFSPAVRTRRKP